MRGPGTTQVAFAIESQMDLLAQRLGIDPLELRFRNRLRGGDRLLSGQVLETDPAYGATLEAVRPHYKAALARCAEADGAPGPRRPGVGVASLWYGIGGGPRGGKSGHGSPPASGRASVDLLPDGSIVVRTGAVDLGQGSDTALGMIAAAALGISVAGLTVQTGDTAANANAGPSGGSRVTLFVGGAVEDAANRMRSEVLETAAGLLGRPVDALALHAGRVTAEADADAHVSLAEIAAARSSAGLPVTFDGTFDVDIPKFDAASGLGEAYPAYVSATEVAEVEVDTATGAVKVLRIVAAHDVGRPVFVAGVVGQVEGGIVMGLGFALSEEFVPGETQGFKQYRIPRAADAPEMITLLVTDDGEPLAKDIAESSNMVAAPAIVNAIAHATGIRVVDLPVRLGRGAAG
jgi:CO/xanthine dehydrogenase Mo-binding subunit